MIKQAACNKKALRNLLLTFNNIIINYAFLFTLNNYSRYFKEVWLG